MAQYYAIITDIGNAQIANAIALGKTISLTHMAVGDANGTQILPIPNQKSLVHETYRAQINSLTIDEENPNVVICEFIIPEDIGGFYVRELGVFDNSGNLIAVGNTPESYKPQMTEGSGAQKVMRMHLVTSASDKIDLKINPSIVVATIDLVNKKVDEINKTIATKADKNHNHDADYAPKTHNHDTAYAPKTHSHSDYALNSHNHDTNYAPKMHTHDYAELNHTHSDLAKIDASNINVPNFLTKLGLKEASLTANGWQKLPSGLILQWAISSIVTSEGNQYVKFPIQFPNACLVAIPATLISDGGTDRVVQVLAFNRTEVVFFHNMLNNVSGNSQAIFLAIGY